MLAGFPWISPLLTEVNKLVSQVAFSEVVGTGLEAVLAFSTLELLVATYIFAPRNLPALCESPLLLHLPLSSRSL